MTDFSHNKDRNLKALVLCAGKGTRLSPLTDDIAKPLIPVANRPILFYVLDRIREIDISEIGIVVSPGNHKQIQQAVGTGSAWQAHVEYIIQTEARGLAHAVISAEDYLKDSPFLMFLGDNLIGDNLVSFINRFRQGKSSASILLKEVPDPSSFGVAELNASGQVTRMVEKPKQPQSSLAMVGIYLFRRNIHRATRQIKPSRRGELEITDALQWLLDNGETVDSHIISGWWLDTGRREDLLTANRVILEEQKIREFKGIMDNLSWIEGNVNLEKGASLVNTTVQGPASIAGGCVISNSTIGPYTSIGPNSRIESSHLENDIIMENSDINNLNLTDSIVGLNSAVFSRINGTEIRGLISACYTKNEL